MVDLPERGAPGWALVTCALGLALGVAVGRVWTPAAAVTDVPEQARVVVVGSSIAMADVTEAGLQRGLDRPVVHLGERAAQPAHWLAVVRHRVLDAGVRPELVVVVSPLDVLLRERLRSDVDTERLLALLTRPDPALWTRAVGDDGRARFWGRQRVAARRVAWGWLGGWLPGVLGWTDALAQARDQASAIPRDVDRPRWVVDPAAPRPGQASDRPQDREPARETVETWGLIPQLADDVAAAGATLVVVAPPVRPSERGPPCTRSRHHQAVQAALEARGVWVVDASEAPLDETWFRTRYHLEAPGPDRFTELLVGVLGGADPPWRVCGPIRGRGAG